MLLLRGFSVYGEKWSLVGIFFLPGRSKQSIEKRWQVKHSLIICYSDVFSYTVISVMIDGVVLAV